MSRMGKTDIAELKKQIAEDPRIVLNTLKTLCQSDKELFNEIIQLDYRQLDLDKKSRMELIGTEASLLVQNKINHALIELLDLIEAKENAIEKNNRLIIGANKYLWSIAFPFLISIILFGSILYAIINEKYALGAIFSTFSLILLCFFGRKVFINFSNRKAIVERAKKYYKHIHLFPKRIKILMEGDSWFNFPLKHDITDHLSEYFNVYSLAEAGDEIKGILRDGNFKKILELEKPEIVLFNAGGKELFEKYFHKLVKKRHDGNSFFTEYFHQVLNDLMHYYEEAIIEIVSENTKVIVNGYDYPIYKKGKMHNLLIKRGFPDPNVVKMKMIDEFNRSLSRIASNFENVYYLDLRNTVTSMEEWYDELHPNEDGFLRISSVYKRKINEIIS